MKFEKTCKCNMECRRPNEGVNNNECVFLKGHEYQVDEYVYLDRSHYKVYPNGGWNDFVFFEENDFREFFELIK